LILYVVDIQYIQEELLGIQEVLLRSASLTFKAVLLAFLHAKSWKLVFKAARASRTFKEARFLIC